MFYDRFLELCAKKGVKPTNACVEAGLSRGLAAKWKSTGTEKPSADALEKMAIYFNMSIEEILGKEKAPTESGSVTDDDLKFALFNGADGITDEMYEEVKRFAQFIKEREKKQYKIASRGDTDHIDLTDEEKETFVDSTEKALKKPQRNDLF